MGKTKMAENVVPLVDKRQEAREAFASYVQSVAFQMTLSRTMIATLRTVRDYGYPAGETDQERVAAQSYRSATCTPNGADNHVTMMRALERRGLVIHDWRPWKEMPKGHRIYKLTRAGALVCELLVEAGLLDPAKPERKRRAKAEASHG